MWALDCVSNEVVLLIPSILALLGDESVQSKFASHVNPKDGLSCRVCVACRKNQCITRQRKDNLKLEEDGEMLSQEVETLVQQYHQHVATYLTVCRENLFSFMSRLILNVRLPILGRKYIRQGRRRTLSTR